MQSNYSNRAPLMCEHNNRAYKQLGNAVNVKVIEYMATQLFGLEP